jgi:hypothetical protein
MLVPAEACQVPVFRYALEHWLPDPFELVVVHQRPLTVEEAEWLRRLQAPEGNRQTNLVTRVIDRASETLSEEVQRFLERYAETGDPAATGDGLPRMLLFFPPSNGTDAPAWAGELTESNCKLIADSPARQEIVQRLLAGESAVWVLLQSGEADVDQAAEERLRESLAQQQAAIHLPSLQELAAEEMFNQALEIPLQIQFSILPIAKGETQEAIFRSLLLAVEPDLADLAAEGTPIAVPIFGRGRSYFALAGAGIRADNVADNAAFICGPCSCEAKRLNPGRDLLLTADWSRIVPRDWNSNHTPLPELTGVGAFEAAVEAQLPSQAADSPAATYDQGPAGVPQKPGSAEDDAIYLASRSREGSGGDTSGAAERPDSDFAASSAGLSTTAYSSQANQSLTSGPANRRGLSYEDYLMRLCGGILAAGACLVAVTSIWSYFKSPR